MKPSLIALIRNTLTRKETAQVQPSGHEHVAVAGAVRELSAAELRWVVGGAGAPAAAAVTSSSPYRGW